ncbi:GMC family oxidoreductase [Neolewinella lacunae]|uniref:GMC family oxidoreductase n=1 Tax=Neolewinella lacunae TaxID=1517758 RepID=A0A923PIZ0_9BACT|nr:GMC family oxidoreductase [Neolewinella lacunae]MBC6995003.1 GMC family oxidoreductase [Neolewinella lacunae]MDN3633226.1 GMC family oxidoreductase [Neolewinella lacunae]
MNFNAQGQDEVSYDAIVVGSGISGGYAAMELCTKGYKVLLLERGRMVKHNDYPTANLDSWDLEFQGKVPREEIAAHYYKQNRLSWWVNQDNKHWIVKDDEYDYEEDQRFDWIRGHHVGGRSIMWGRHCYRLSDLDFEANLKDGIAVDWPIRYADIAPWYTYVEKFVGVQGKKEGLAHLPDGEFLPPFDLNCAEDHFKQAVEAKWPVRRITPGRTANLTQYIPELHHGTRGKCQARNRCWRGCPFGGYFSSLSATIPVANETGNLTLVANSVVHSVIYDDQTQRATGVRVIDAETQETREYFAKVLFLNASTIGSTAILLNSKSERFPNGLGNDSGELGHNLMDHHYGMGGSGIYTGHKDKYYSGRKPNGGFYIPRFRNISKETERTDYIRGFGYQGGAARGINTDAPLGPGFKTAITSPGEWTMRATCFGELLPYHENRVYLHAEKTDQYGIPKLVFDASLKENERKLRIDGVECLEEMLLAAGCENVQVHNQPTAPGAAIHEMGTARMGRDPRTSVLNKWNQVHAVPNVFVTDGSFMTSAGTQNPSITYMAMTARAVDYLDKTLRRDGRI